MKEVVITSKVVGREGAGVPAKIGQGSTVDLSAYLLKAIWDKVWEIRTDSTGKEYIFGKLPVVTQYGITMYAGDGGDVDLPSLYAGLPIDNTTIYWENGVLKAAGSSGGGGVADSVAWANVYGKPSWITDTKPDYAYSEITGTPDLSKYALKTDIPSLSGYATESWVLNKGYALGADLDALAVIVEKKADKSYVDGNFVTLATDQTISGLKNFSNGLELGGIKLSKSQEGIVYIEGNLVVQGGITMYGTGATDVPSIIDSLPIASTSSKGIAYFDSNYFSVDSDGKVSFIGASGGGLDLTALQNYLTQNSYLNVTEGDGRYLKLEGGAMSGDIELGLNPKSSTSTTYAILFTSTSNKYLYAKADELYFGLDSGTTGKILTSLNIGSYTVGSATKLQNARTIWGQTFDGTANVSGDLSLNSSKIVWHGDSKNYYITCPATSESAYIEYNGYGGHTFLGGAVSFNNSITLKGTQPATARIIMSRSSYNYINYPADGSLCLGTANDTASTQLFIAGSTGNVGIGTSQPTGKLHVLGNSHLKGTIFVTNTEATTINEDSGKIKFNSLNVSDTLRSPYIQAIYQGNYSRKRLSIFQSNATNYTDDFVEVFTILPNGNVGIGVVQPNRKLEVGGSARFSYLGDTNNYGGIYVSQSDENFSESSIQFEYSDSTLASVGYSKTYGAFLYDATSKSRLRVSSTDGLLYHYINSTQYRIWTEQDFNYNNYLPLSGGTMSGSITFPAKAKLEKPIRFNTGEYIDAYGNFYLGSDSTSWNVRTSSGTYLFSVYNNGKVKVGSATREPLGELDLVTTNKQCDLYIGSTGNYISSINFVHSDVVEWQLSSRGSGATGTTSVKNAFVVYDCDGTNWTNRFTITKSGYIGINNYNPSEMLHLKGKSECRVLLEQSSNGGLYYRAKGVTYDISFGLSSGGVNRGIYDNTNSGWILYRGSNTNVIFPSGNIGIGTTSPTHKLHISSTGAIPIYLAHNYSTQYAECFNAHNSGLVSGQYYSLCIGYASATKNRGVLSFYYDGNGSNNNRISLAIHGVDNILNVLGSGNVGIGVTSPTYKLQVDGTMYVSGSTTLGSTLNVNGDLRLKDSTNYGCSLYFGDSSFCYIQEATDDVMTIYASSGIKLNTDGSNITMNTNLLVSGGITMYNTSDKRKKKNIRTFNASQELMSLGGVYQFEYNDDEVEKNGIYKGTHVGLIYQNVKGTILEKMCYEREDGFGALNYLDSSFISLIAAVEIEHETRIQKLERENEELRKEIEQLKAS